MSRELVAYALIALMLAVVMALVALRRYHSHERTYARQQRRDRARRQARLHGTEPS